MTLKGCTKRIVVCLTQFMNLRSLMFQGGGLPSQVILNQEVVTGFGLMYRRYFCQALESLVEQSSFVPYPSDNEENDEILSSDHSEEVQKKAHDTFIWSSF